MKAAQTYPRTPLADLWVFIDYHIIPPTYEVYPLSDYHQLVTSRDYVTMNPPISVTDPDIIRLRLEKKTLIVAALSCGMHAGIRVHILSDFLWDRVTDPRVEAMKPNAKLSPSGFDLFMHSTAAFQGSASRTQPRGRSEMSKPALKRLMDNLVDEEHQRYDDIQGTWLMG